MSKCFIKRLRDGAYLDLHIDSGGMSTSWCASPVHCDHWDTVEDARSFITGRLAERYPGEAFNVVEMS